MGCVVSYTSRRDTALKQELKLLDRRIFWQREIVQIRGNSRLASEIILQYIERSKRRVDEEGDNLSKPKLFLEN